MKKILFFFIAIIALTPSLVSAKSFTYITPDKTVSVAISTTQTDASIAVTSSGYNTYSITVYKTRKPTTGTTAIRDQYTDQIYNGSITTEKKQSDGVWQNTLSIKGLFLQNTTYYLLLENKYGIEFNTDAATISYTQQTTGTLSHLTYGPVTNRSVVVQGKLTVTNPPGYTQFNDPINGFKLSLRYAQQTSQTQTDLSGTDVYASSAYQDKEGTKLGIASDGTYYYYLADLSTNMKYCTQEVVTPPGGAAVLGTIDCGLDGGLGYAAVGSTQDIANQESQSYRLLAPLPGLSTLLDPRLCAQKRSAGQLGEGAICDVNDFVAYALKLLIGITAVFLVVRIILEGYKYMTSDIPALKTNIKQKLTESLLGLLLALSSYLILNTINPKLVEGVIQIDQIGNGVKEYASVSATDYAKITGKQLQPKSELIPIVKKIATEEGVDACLIAATIQYESDWNPATLGADEDVRSTSVPSRIAFIKGGIKYSGALIPTGSTVMSPVFNDDAIRTDTVSSAKPGYGIDWRFSVGIGLMQLTLFPEGYNGSNTDAYGAWVKANATTTARTTAPIGIGDNKKYAGLTTFADFLDPEKNIRAGTQEMKRTGKNCMNDPEAFLRAYNGGAAACDINKASAFSKEQGAKRYQTYLSCKSSGTF